MRRGDIYTHATFPRQFVVVSTDRLTHAGTAIVAEIHPDVPTGTRGMLAVPLTEQDPLRGAVLAWRVNYLAADRLGEHLGRLSAETIEVMDMALRTAMDL